jgi:uncharacterized protein (DUF736 family)
MAVIGSFVQEKSGFSGTIATLTCAPAAIMITPVRKPNPNAPDYRLYRGSSEIGAAWSKTAKNGRTYFIVTLDDPAFPQPVAARLVASSEGFVLLWSRD